MGRLNIKRVYVFLATARVFLIRSAKLKTATHFNEPAGSVR